MEPSDTASNGVHVDGRSDIADNDVAFVSPVLRDLITRSSTLLSELEAFRNRLRTLRQESNVELGHFRGIIQSEVNTLERLASVSSAELIKAEHVAKSSNLPFLETIWRAVKRSKNVIALHKRIFTAPGVKQLSRGLRHVDLNQNDTDSKGSKKGPKRGAVVVDAITDSGRTWIKLSLVTDQRLLFDLAKQGWDSEGSDDESLTDDDQEDRDVPLLKTAKDLTKAAQCFRARTWTPSVKLLLPRIQLGRTPEVAKIIADCRATGAVVVCGGEEDEATLSLEESLVKMAPDSIDSFSSVLNIDCTILLALVSEFSHARVNKEPWFHPGLRRQVEIEDNERLLPSLLYPAMADHKLVSTRAAVTRMREIVDNIGTTSEKARTAILLGDENKPHEQLVEEMQEWSAYPVPQAWQLPVMVVDEDESHSSSTLPPEAMQICAGMTSINRAVFLSGWANGRTTITSNRLVVKRIENELEKLNNLNDSVWPSIWLCPTARSLVGKEKRNARKGEAKESAWPLPDPLRREAQRRNGLDVLSLREGYDVDDLRPNGYPCEEVIAAKNASLR